MKLGRVSLVISSVLALSACSTIVSGGNNAPAVFSAQMTLQGTLMDAQSGKRLGGDDLEVHLIQGLNQRRPDRLVTNSQDPMVGEFAFSGIPLPFNSGNVTYRLVVRKNNYIRFEHNLSPFASRGSSNLVDSTYNFMGDVYLFPLGTFAPTYRFQLIFNGKPVPDATAMLVPKSSGNEPVALRSSFTFAANTGYLEALTAKSDAEGVVEFQGGALGLGAVYDLKVLPTTFEGVDLLQNDSLTNLLVGKAVTRQVLTLQKAAPGNSFGLFVTSVSNSVPGQVDGSGRLAITFNRRITLNNGTNFWATTTGTGTFAAAPNPRVRASLSPDGLTLTLEPIWLTNPSDTSGSQRITYSALGIANGFTADPSISVEGYPGVTFSPFNLQNAAGGNISPEVLLTNP
ncbi:MAG: hypothetical protein VKO21_04695 [Candidatus Sericytochromatia bacterium]|nr:hypothetical protein [Candidatus Sericytochromatia bacterium]